MKLNFTKMQGAGNDFVVIDDLGGRFPVEDRALIRRLAARRMGIGCEGVIVIRPGPDDASADFTMLFFNPDGSRASMCGNATRCLALFAFEHGIGGRVQRMATDAGPVVAEILDARRGYGTVRVALTPPRDRREQVSVALTRGRVADCFHVNTGVPHAVVFVEDAEAVDVVSDGRAIRHAAVFSPSGVNVDFVSLLPDGSVRARTYERGVEDESGACGTGAVAVAIALVERRGGALPVVVRFGAGMALVVDGVRDAAGLCHAMRLTGPARLVFEGCLETSWTDEPIV